jgi:ligand-binding sensor domain-containing protein/two-component sensor histidine kinase
MIRAAVLGIAVAVLLGQALASFALDPQRTLSQYGYQQWQSNAGLPEDSVHAILQSSDGYIWLATDSGLVRFNGFTFRVFNTENTAQMHSNVIRSLIQDRSGALWISTADGLLSYRDHQFQAFDTANGLLSNAVWFVHQDRAGRLLAGTSAGLSVMSDRVWKPLAHMNRLNPENEKQIADAPDGSIWIAGGNQLVHLDSRSFAVREHLRIESTSEISAIACDFGGNLWVATQQGLEVYSQGGLQPIVLGPAARSLQVNTILPTTAKSAWVGTSQGVYLVNASGKAMAKPVSGLPPGPATILLLDREGSLWIGTNRGVARLQQNRVDAFPVSSDPPVNTIDDLFEDREGNLWIGGESVGLAVLRDQKFTTFTKRDGLSSNMITSIYGDRDATLWIGTDGSGLNHMSGTGVSAYGVTNGLSSNVILALASDQRGNLWVGTPTGLNRMHDGKVRVYTVADGLADDFVRSLFVDQDGSLWVGTRHGLAHMSGEQFVNYSSSDGLGSDFVGAILRARDGRLWIGTSGGLSFFRNGTFATLTTHDGLSKDIITAIYEEEDGTLWLGTNGGGLNRLRGNVITPFSGSELPSVIYGILQDRAGDLWLSSPLGVYRVSHASLNAAADQSQLQITAYGTGAGMKTRECSGGGHPEAWKQSDGSLWFATAHGVASIVPSHFAQNHVPPQTVIESVLIDDRPSDALRALILTPGRHRIEFHYAGLSFVMPQLVEYRYRLEGYDRDWIDGGHLRSAYYTNLPPGRYTFQVLSSNNDGVWAQTPMEVSFQIKPYFYQTSWFYLALGLFTLWLACLIYQRNLRRVRNEFSAVLAERSRIAREIHDTLAQDIVSISLQLEIISRLLGGPVQTVREHLDRTRDLVKRSLVDARSSIWTLRAQDQQPGDLPARLAAQLRESNRDSSVRVFLDVQGTYRALDQRTENELLRIGKEAVGNAIRHAAACRVDVKLLYDAETVCLRVEDDGQGFDPLRVSDHRKGHFGLQGMRERAAEIRASFHIESKPGQGTQICVELPV